MLKFNDYLKEAALSAKQKKIAAVAGDKDKIDSADLTALRAGKKPVEEACSDKDMKKEELVGKQHKLDKNKNGKVDAHDFKLLRKEAKDGWSQNDSLAKPVTSGQAMADHSKYFNKVTKLDPKTGEPIKKDVKEEAEQIDEAQRIGRKADGSLGFMDDKKDAPIKDHHLAKDVHQSNLQKHLGNHTGDKKNTYFDGTDLVHGDKTVVRNASGASSKHTIGDLKKALDKHVKGLKEEIELDEGRVKELAYDLDNMSHDEFHKQYGKPKHYYDPKNFKKPVEPGKGMDRAKALAQRGMQSLSKEEVERIEEKLAQLGEGTYKHEVEKSFPASGVKTGDSAPKGTTYMPKDKEKAKGKPAGSIGEEVEQEMSPYLKGTLKVMDEGKIDNLRDAQKLRQDMQSAYDKDYKPDTSHPHIQVVKGTAYGGENQKDDEGDEKPDETKEKKGRGRPTGSKSGARQKGGGHEDGGIPVHNLNLPKSYK